MSLDAKGAPGRGPHAPLGGPSGGAPRRRPGEYDLPADPETPAVLWAYDVFPDGRADPVAPREVGGPKAEGAAYRWIHLDGLAPGAEDWLASGAAGPLPEILAEALTETDTRPRAQAAHGGALVFLRGVNLNEGADVEDMISVRVWMNETRVLTVVLRRLLTVAALRADAEANRAPARPGVFLTELTEGLAERMSPVLDALEDRADDMEDRAAEAVLGMIDPLDPREARRELAELRRVGIALRRYLGPQRDALTDLRRLSSAPLTDLDRAELGETGDRMTRYVEDLDAIRERALVLGEEAAARAAERSNRAMYVLSIVTAVFLPLGFLTGLLGVNLGGLPGQAAPWGFAVFVALLAVVAGLELWLIRKLRLL
ncbi:CorA family divalent cation transporter [Albimonas sp. CAU 1670]|uniref:CorA family divalent cation transporter n=1 Tax=Albimonas sp. CAU 1670 TaxID=3032599 RepID=UPI0023DCE02A|nr:CorA family divalent cation transporter [Albimonas sp. CAU 1670]MDF2232598.1 CorA family divalent cation transporter [Albimonas sp. CAU 1670]